MEKKLKSSKIWEKVKLKTQSRNTEKEINKLTMKFKSKLTKNNLNYLKSSKKLLSITDKVMENNNTNQNRGNNDNNENLNAEKNDNSVLNKNKQLLSLLKHKSSNLINNSDNNRQVISTNLEEQEENPFLEGFKTFFKDIFIKENNKQFLLTFGMNIKEKDEEGRNIIHRACFNLKLAIVTDIIERMKSNLLFNSNEYLNEPDNFGNTPLLLVCKQYNMKLNEDRLNILKILVNNGAVFKVVQPSVLWTPMHWLSFNKAENCIIEYIKETGDLHYCPDKDGFFPIDLAGIRGDSKIVELFVQHTINKFDYIFSNKNANNNVIEGNKAEKTNKGFFFNMRNRTNTNNNNNLKDTFINIYDNSNKNTGDKELQNLGAGLFFGFKNIKKHRHLPNEEKKEIPLDKLDCKLDPHLKKLFITIYLNHCLYWVCKLKLNYIYVNQLLEIGVDPTVSKYN